MATEERLVDVEIRIARQEDLIDVLNKTVYEQQKKIDELEALCTALARHVKDLRDAASDAVADTLALERPPHY
jgi:SlyX protein